MRLLLFRSKRSTTPTIRRRWCFTSGSRWGQRPMPSMARSAIRIRSYQSRRYPARSSCCSSDHKFQFPGLRARVSTLRPWCREEWSTGLTAGIASLTMDSGSMRKRQQRGAGWQNLRRIAYRPAEPPDQVATSSSPSNGQRSYEFAGIGSLQTIRQREHRTGLKHSFL